MNGTGTGAGRRPHHGIDLGRRGDVMRQAEPCSRNGFDRQASVVGQIGARERTEPQSAAQLEEHHRAVFEIGADDALGRQAQANTCCGASATCGGSSVRKPPDWRCHKLA